MVVALVVPPTAYSHEMPNDEDRRSERISHLELVQGVINRLSNSQYILKGWALTIAGALLGVAIKDLNWWLAFAGLLSTIAFGIFDIYLLHTERLFRALFTRLRIHPSSVQPFFMAATRRRFKARLFKVERSWPKAIGRPAVLMFYVPILIVTGLASACLHSKEAGRTMVVVSRRYIPAGSRLNRLINRGAFAYVQIPTSLLTVQPVESIDDLRNKRTVARIFPNEQVPEGRLELP